MSRIVLLGAGGHGRSVLNAALRAGYDVAGFLDPKLPFGHLVIKARVIGRDEDAAALAQEGCEFVVTVGNLGDSKLSQRLHAHILGSGGRLITIIARSANVSPHSTIGDGTVVLEGACIGPEARVGTGCIINTLSDVEHDCEVGAYTHISTGAILNGGSRVGARCFVGSHATIAQGVRVCDDVVIGAASLVLHDITEPGTYVGVPCRRV